MTEKILEELCPLNIEDEYRKSKGLKPEEIAAFRKWILSNPNYPTCIPDAMLALFLHSADYNIEEAKKHIENYLKLRSNTPEFFENRDPENESLQTAWELISCWVSKEPTPENYRVIYTGFLNPDPKNYNFGDAMKAFMLVVDWLILTYGSTPGVIAVFDAEGATYKHLLKLKLNLIMKGFSYIQDAIPVIIRQIHVINVVPVIDKVMILVKPFIKKDLFDKIVFYSGSDLTEFYKKVPLEMLPADIGGKAKKKQELQDEMIEDIQKLKDWFSAEEKYFRLNKKMNAQDNEIIESETELLKQEGSSYSLCID